MTIQLTRRDDLGLEWCAATGCTYGPISTPEQLFAHIGWHLSMQPA